MMDKPFRTIEEQIAILNSRGVATDKSTPKVLAREGRSEERRVRERV